MSQRRCGGCRHWYDAKAAACPFCRTAAPRFNIHLKAARCNNQLYSQAAHAAAEKAYADAHGI